MSRLSNLDAMQSAFFLRDLEQIKSTTYDILYPDLKGRLFVSPSIDKAPPGTKTITYRQFDRVGMAKIIADYAKDLPRVEVFGKEFTSPVRRIANAFGYTIDEIRSASLTNVSLPAAKARAARDVIEETLDELIAVGDSDNGLVGFLNNANVPQAAVATVGLDTTWAQKNATDPALIVDDVTDAFNDMLDATKGRHAPDTLIVPPGEYGLLTSSAIIDTGESLLERLRRSIPTLKTIDWWHKLKTAGAGGTKRFVLYQKSARNAFYEIPEEFEMLEPQDHALEFEVPCTATSGGVIMPYPLAHTYRDGI